MTEAFNIDIFYLGRSNIFRGTNQVLQWDIL